MAKLSAKISELLAYLEDLGLNTSAQRTPSPLDARLNRFANLSLIIISVATLPFLISLTLGSHLPFEHPAEPAYALAVWFAALAIAAMGALLLKAKGFLKLAAYSFILLGAVHCLVMGAHFDDQMSVGLLFGTVLLSSLITLRTIEASGKQIFLFAVLVLVYGISFSSAKEFFHLSDLSSRRQDTIELINLFTVVLYNFICFSVLFSDFKTKVESQLSESNAIEKRLLNQRYLRLYDELKTAQETGKVGTWTWNETTQKIECTPEIARLLGFIDDVFVSQNTLQRLTQLSFSVPQVLSKIDQTERFSVLRNIHRAYFRREYLVVRFRVSNGETIAHRELVGRFERMTPKSAESFRGTLRDVTAEENAEEALRERENLRVLNENMNSLGRLAGEVAHEVNNPLAIVVGRLQQVQKMLRANVPMDAAFLQRFVKSVETSVNRIHKVSQTLLSFSASLDTVPIGIHTFEQILDSVEMKMDQMITRKRVKIERQGSVHAKIHCQPTQIKLLVSQILECILAKVSSPTDFKAEDSGQFPARESTAAQVAPVGRERVFSEESLTITIVVSQLPDSIDLDFKFPAELSPDLELLVPEHKIATESYLSEARFEAYLLQAVLQVHQGSLSFTKGHINGNLLLRLPRHRNSKKVHVLAS